MRILLDSHIWVWYLTNPNQISSHILEELNNPQIEVAFSIVSYWEFKIKQSQGKIELHPDIIQDSEKIGVQMLQFATVECEGIATLPQIHKDPFDRMLICQAIHNNMVLATADSEIAKYKDVPGLFLLLN